MSCTSTATTVSSKAKASELSATSPISTPGTNTSFYTKSNEVLTTHGHNNVVPSTKKSIPDEHKVWIQFRSNRDPIPTPNESLSKWRSSNHRGQEEGIKAIRMAMYLRRLDKAGIIVKEEKITEEEKRLWNHPTLSSHRCRHPSPLRGSMSFRN